MLNTPINNQPAHNQFSLRDVKALIIDMDGVLWRGETLLPGFNDFFTFMRQHQIPFTLATNNARKTPAQYISRFKEFGVTISEEEVMTSALATVDYLKMQYPTGSNIYVIGERGIRKGVKDAGFTLVEEANTTVVAVVVGLDFDITYHKLKLATVLINQGADFIGTNPDLTFPFEGGIAPGNGALLAAIEAATNKKPIIIGKPEAIIFKMALQKMSVDYTVTAMLGDRLETDILGGQQAALKTILVLSGVTTATDLTNNTIQPDWVFTNLQDLLNTWQKII